MRAEPLAGHGRPVLGSGGKAALKLLAMAVENQPKALAGLLESHGLQSHGGNRGESLMAAVLRALPRGGARLHRGLAKLLAMGPGAAHDSFDPASLASAGGGAIAGQVSAITNAVGSVASLLGGGARAKRQARSSAFSSLVGYRAHKERLAAERLAMLAKERENDKKRKAMADMAVKAVLAALGAALVMALLSWRARQRAPWGHSKNKTAYGNKRFRAWRASTIRRVSLRETL